MQNVALANGIKEYLNQTGLSVDTLGSFADASRASVYRALKGTLKDKEVITRLARVVKVPISSIYSADVEHINDLNVYLQRVKQIEQLSVSTLRVSSPLIYQATTAAYDKFLTKIWSALIEQAEPSYKAAIRGMIESLQDVQQQRKAAFRKSQSPIINVIVLDRLKDLLTRGVAGSLNLSDALRAEARSVAAIEANEIATAMESGITLVKHGVLDAAGMMVSFDVADSNGRSFLVVSPFSADMSPTMIMNLAMVTTDEGTLAGYRHIGEAAQKQMLTGKAGSVQIRKMLAENQV